MKLVTVINIDIIIHQINVCYKIVSVYTMDSSDSAEYYLRCQTK